MMAGLAGYEDDNDPTVKGAWQITTTTSADWAIQRKAECDAEAEEIDRQAEAAIARIRARADALKAKAARGAAYFTYKLAEWAERNRETLLHGKKKSRDFIAGTIGWRKAGGRLKVNDKDALLAWLVTQPIESGLYRMAVEPEMRALQESAKRDGPIPPGCIWEPESETFYVKTEAPATTLAKKE
jgi:phage host-nuclease inhibitor protein Gam